MSPPRSILKASPDSVRPLDGDPVPHLTLPAPRRSANSVRFPPSPTLTRTFVAHSPQTYDRSPIVVLPNTCALPARGCPGQTYHPDSSAATTRGSPSPKHNKHVHPSRVAAALPDAASMPPLVFDLSESDDSDGIASPPPAFPPPPHEQRLELSLACLSLSFLPHAGPSALFHTPEPAEDTYQHHYEEDKQRRRRDRGHKGSRHSSRHGARSRERTAALNGCAREEGLDGDEDDGEDEDMDGCSVGGRYKTFGDRSALSSCGFDDTDDGCLGGF